MARRGSNSHSQTRKDLSDPGNFRPIALSSCVCKTMETMTNARLMWSLEPESLLSEKQCGFRKYHSTLDHLDRFETFISKAFVNKGHARLSLSLRRPTQRESRALWQTLGISVSGASSLCLFRASCPNVLSGSEWAPLCQSCTMGVRQGSILSPALFSTKVNNSVNAVLKGTDCSLFVDDFALCVWGGGGISLNRVERAMELCVNGIQDWVLKTIFSSQL